MMVKECRREYNLTIVYSLQPSAKQVGEHIRNKLGQALHLTENSAYQKTHSSSYTYAKENIM